MEIVVQQIVLVFRVRVFRLGGLLSIIVSSKHEILGTWFHRLIVTILGKFNFLLWEGCDCCPTFVFLFCGLWVALVGCLSTGIVDFYSLPSLLFGLFFFSQLSFLYLETVRQIKKFVKAHRPFIIYVEIASIGICLLTNDWLEHVHQLGIR